MDNQFLKEPWFLESLMDNLPDAIIITDLNAKIIYVNKAVVELFGYSEEELIGKDPIIFNAEPGASEIQRDIENTLLEDRTWKNKILNQKKNGDLFVVDCTVSPLKDNKENVIGYIGFQKDVTEMEDARMEVMLSEQKYKTIFDSAPTAVIMVDEAGIIVNCNKKVKDLFGYEREEIIGSSFHKLVHPDYYIQGNKQLEAIVNNKLDASYIEYKFIKKDDSIIDVSINSTSIRDKDGEFLHTICFLTDITEGKKSELALRELATELQQSNKELEQFAYVASHDLQEPLRVIASYCHLLKDKHYHDFDEDSKKYMDYSISSALRMKVLIRDLLDFSRVGRKDKPFEHVDIREIINEVMGDYEISITEKNAKIIIEENLPVVFAIRFRIKQLMANLISNALKFHSKRSPVINISCCDEGSFWLFCIQDNGVGIDSLYFEKIFGIFKRLYSKDEYPGTGIGLALCRRIIETHGGKIWVDSEEDRGTCMYFTISKHIKVTEVIVL